jgi:hypothetical protein
VSFGWCVDEGLLGGNSPAGSCAGGARAGAARSAWSCPAVPQRPLERLFGPYLLLLLPTGHRRTETAPIRWENVDLAGDVWSIPAAVTKTGQGASGAAAACVVPAPAGGPPRASQRPSMRATAVAGMALWTPHDLRRTMRSRLSAGLVEVLPYRSLKALLSAPNASRRDSQRLRQVSLHMVLIFCLLFLAVKSNRYSRPI